MSRPKDFEFMMDFLGGQEEVEIREYISSLESQIDKMSNISEWISVKDGLPETPPLPIVDNAYYSDSVLVTDGKQLWVDNLHVHGFWWEEDENGKGKFTHWMPLPEPPKDKP